MRLDARAQDVGLEARRERAGERLRRDDEVERLGGAPDLDERRDGEDRRPTRACMPDAQHVGVEELRRLAVALRSLVGEERPPARREAQRDGRPLAVDRRGRAGGLRPRRGRRCPSAGRLSCTMRRATSIGVDRLRADALAPIGGAGARGPARGDRCASHPASEDHGTQRPSPSSLQRLEDHLAHDARGARVARLGREAEHLGLGARLVPRAAAAPRDEELPRELLQRGAARRRRRCSSPMGSQSADRARQRDDERHVRGSRPKRAASFCTSDFGVPTPARTSAKAPDCVRPRGCASTTRARRWRRSSRAAPDRARSARVAARGRRTRRRASPLRAARRARCGAPRR